MLKNQNRLRIHIDHPVIKKQLLLLRLRTSSKSSPKIWRSRKPNPNQLSRLISHLRKQISQASLSQSKLKRTLTLTRASLRPILLSAKNQDLRTSRGMQMVKLILTNTRIFKALTQLDLVLTFQQGLGLNLQLKAKLIFKRQITFNQRLSQIDKRKLLNYLLKNLIRLKKKSL